MLQQKSVGHLYKYMFDSDSKKVLSVYYCINFLKFLLKKDFFILFCVAAEVFFFFYISQLINLHSISDHQALKKAKQPVHTQDNRITSHSVSSSSSVIKPLMQRSKDSDESDNEDRVPVPRYQASFSDAIQSALESLNTEENGMILETEN